MAEQERAAIVRAAQRLRAAGFRLPGGERRLDAPPRCSPSTWRA
jgi:hypothetical protein